MNFLWVWCMKPPLLSLFAEPLASFPAPWQISKAQKTLEHSTFHSWRTKINQRHSSLLFKSQSKQREINGLSISLPFHSSVCIFLSCLLSSFLFLLFSSSFVSCYDKHDSCHGGIQPWGLWFTSGEWQGRSRTVGDSATWVYLAVPRDEVLAGSAVGME